METSCGFILINYDSVLLLQYPQGHWSFPKGHVEESDSDYFSTASRELLEETGISKVSLIDGWSSRTEYSFLLKGVPTSKQVFWYLAETDELNVKLSHEHTNYMWLIFDEAIQQVTFDQEIELLNSAKEYLKSIQRI
ncbi:NUDIX domain-containing protein [Candidatus Poseidoniales archaeon]|nr:NUDIX domain-containing protein [Candidatus Poseidoniales archaeon]